MQELRVKFRMYAGDLVDLMPEDLDDNMPSKQQFAPRNNNNNRDFRGRPQSRRPRPAPDYKFEELLSRGFEPEGGGARRRYRSVRDELDEIRGRTRRGDE